MGQSQHVIVAVCSFFLGILFGDGFILLLEPCFPLENLVYSLISRMMIVKVASALAVFLFSFLIIEFILFYVSLRRNTKVRSDASLNGIRKVNFSKQNRRFLR